MTYKVLQGDCLEVMPALEANSIDTIITDPPYGLGFMGKQWDHGVPGVQFWQAALRVAKPGAMLLAFGGTRTFHRLTCAIEDAGWEVRDVVSWLYGSGFPKSLDISKAIDKAAGAEREILGESPYNARRPNPPVSERYKQGGWPANITAPATPAAATWAGWGTALKPAWEPIILAMKPLDGTFAENALAWGVAGLNVDGARIGTAADLNPNDYDDSRRTAPKFSGKYNNGKEGQYCASPGAVPAGRWPANLILDEETAAYLDAQSGDLSSGTMQAGTFRANRYGWAGAMPEQTAAETYGDSGGASRFFYVAKAARSERDAGLNGMEALQIDDSREPDAPGANNPRNRGGRKATNFHPTVKPVELMRYLCRLTATPTGGIVLDPFMGSGTTGVACVLEGREFIGIDKEAHYCAIAEQRLATTQPALFGG
mgnify:FL=1